MGIIIYRLFLWLYQAGAFLISPWNQKAILWRKGRRNILERIQNTLSKEASPIVWIHCASLGEFEQGRPLIERIKTQYPRNAVLLTFFSPSAFEVTKKYKGADYIFYLPMDGPSTARKFLEIVKPQLVLWIKYDYWHYYLEEIRNRHIPLLLVSGIFRKGQPFFKWYGRFHREMLGHFTQFFVQGAESKKLLGSIGFSENVTVSGDTRFDRVIEIAEQQRPVEAIESFVNGAQVIVAGSTWEEDEEELDHFANMHPEIKFIIAPHEIDETHLQEIEQLFHHTIRYSELKPGSELEIPEPSAWTRPSAPINVLIIDNMGMLASLYRYSDITYVGGGFGHDGVHNVLEAAVYAKPVVFGPVYEKYREAVDLIEAGAAFSIENALELESVFTILLKKPAEFWEACKASKDYVYSNQGATGKVLQYIQEKRLLTN